MKKSVINGECEFLFWVVIYIDIYFSGIWLYGMILDFVLNIICLFIGNEYDLLSVMKKECICFCFYLKWWLILVK